MSQSGPDTIRDILSRKPTTLFIVDDEFGIRRLLVKILTHAGYHVIENKSAREAIQNLSHTIPALIVSDVVMPEMDGLDLCNHVRKNPATDWIPFLFLTAKEEEKDRILGLESGADAYLVKPFSNRELLIHISNILQRLRKISELLSIPPADRLDIPISPPESPSSVPEDFMSLEALDTLTRGFLGEMRVKMLIDLLQFISAYPETYMISLINPDRTKAALFLRNSVLVHAICGEMEGDAALDQIMRWDKGLFRVRRIDKAPPQTMEKHIEQLAFKHYISMGTTDRAEGSAPAEKPEAGLISVDTHRRIQEITQIRHRVILFPVVSLDETPLSRWLVTQNLRDKQPEKIMRKHFADDRLPGILDLGSSLDPPILAPVYTINEYLNQGLQITDRLSAVTFFIGSPMTDDRFDYFAYVLGNILDSIQSLPLCVVTQADKFSVIPARDFFASAGPAAIQKKLTWSAVSSPEQQLRALFDQLPDFIKKAEQ